MSEKLYSIQEVSQRLKVAKHTLRFWEKEFQGVLVPIRTEGGQRRYRANHIKILEEIKALKKAGKSLAEIKDSLQQDSELRIDRQDSETIDLLAKRIAEVLRDEIFNYLKANDSDYNTQEATES